jgi:sugar (pentulose or hexulose) kinase
VGTTSAKAVLFDTGGHSLAAGSAATPWRPVASGAEMGPGDLRVAVLEAIASALSGQGEIRVAAIGVTSMAETGVLLDATGRHLAPLIAWFDTRGEDQAAALAQDVPRFPIHAGVPLSPTPSMVKHRWLVETGLLAAPPRRWLNVAEWVVKELGGEEVAERSLSSRTGYLDIHRVAWRPELLEWARMPADLLAPLRPAGRAAGRCRIGDARLDGAVLCVGGHDHICAALGAGLTEGGDVLASMGTAQALVRTLPAAPPEAQVEETVVGCGITVGPHVLDGRWALLAGGLFGGILAHRPEALPDLLRRVAGDLRAMDRIFGPHRRVVAVGGWSRRPEVLAAERAALGGMEAWPELEAGCWGAALLAGRAAELIAPPR